MILSGLVRRTEAFALRCFASHGLSRGSHPHAYPSKTAFNGKLPVVYHPSYSAPRLGPHHRFPMPGFERIYDRLLNHHHLIEPGQVHIPTAAPVDDLLCMVHDRRYLDSFTNGRLDEAQTRRIGFGVETASPVLIERTKMEVAGTLLTARLAMEHGMACNTAGGEWVRS